MTQMNRGAHALDRNEPRHLVAAGKQHAPVQIASVGRALPPHRYTQETLVDGFRHLWGEARSTTRLEQFHRNVRVGARHLALPMEAYGKLDGFGAANDAFIRCAVDLGERAIADALAQSGLTPRAIDHLFFVSVTGIATPSIDARLVNRMGLRSDVKRTPIFGLGCVAGAVGITRVADYLRAWPDQVAVLLSVELCSLTLQRRDRSVRNLIASGLFGDGAAAVVMAPGNGSGPRPRVVASRSNFYPNTEHVMGWEVTGDGFRVILSGDVPKMAHALRPEVDAFLAERGLTLADIDRFVCHPGGPKVLEAIEETLALPTDALARTWASLRGIGNLSSASVLFVLGDTLAADPPPPGGYGLMIAMGPGFCSELVLLQW